MLHSHARIAFDVVCAALAVAVLAPGGAANVQVPGFVEITQPAPGDAVSGLVTIYGSADHPAFTAYDLAFAYAENPTNTWFPIGEPSQLAVVGGRLGLWDTSEIVDGDYLLRLRVWLQDGTSLEDVVAGVRVRNQSPAEIPTPIPAATLAPALTSTPTPSLPPPPSAPTSSSHRSRAADALATGVLAALVGLGLLALYTLTRSALRPRWADLRTRYFHWQDSRRRRRGRRRSR